MKSAIVLENILSTYIYFTKPTLKKKYFFSAGCVSLVPLFPNVLLRHVFRTFQTDERFTLSVRVFWPYFIFFFLKKVPFPLTFFICFERPFFQFFWFFWEVIKKNFFNLYSFCMFGFWFRVKCFWLWLKVFYFKVKGFLV